ncbi:transglycosylase SLT domain-containing protein [bacterium]|nr:transglycosylase SLT domain-containing protein [bacterium]
MILKKQIFMFVLVPLAVFGQDENFEDFLKKQSQQQQEFSQNETLEQQKAVLEWQNFMDEQEKQWETYKTNTQKIFGEFQESTPKNWVTYDLEERSKTEVNFEKGEIKVEVLLEKNENAQEKLSEVSKELLKTSDKESSIFSEQLPIKEEKTGEKIQFENKSLDKFLSKTTKENSKISKPFKNSEEKEVVKATLTIKLNSDHISKRAEKYLPFVETYSQKFGVEPELVLAIIRNESAFNPVVTSVCNGKPCATGLMQLVPWSGGKTAFNSLGFEGQPTRDYLKDPEKNIELGTKYLSILMEIFKEIQHETKIRYLTICSYNTGTGNVARGLIRQNNVSLAVDYSKKVNETELFTKLTQDLPYEETRNYLKKVTASYKTYKEN